ncbi:MAG: TPM domain-containing protein, partial [Chitinophagales bacterium]
MPQARTFFTAEQQQEIIRAIRNAEMDTSGEIRLHLEESCGDDVLDRAADIFRKLEMHKTELR